MTLEPQAMNPNHPEFLKNFNRNMESGGMIDLVLISNNWNSFHDAQEHNPIFINDPKLIQIQTHPGGQMNDSPAAINEAIENLNSTLNHYQKSKGNVKEGTTFITK